MSTSDRLLSYFIMRLRQFARISQYVGWVRSVLILSALVTGFFLFCNSIIHYPQNYILLIVVLLMLMYTHAIRRDKNFIQNLNMPHLFLFWIEYMVAIIPLVVISLWYREWVMACLFFSIPILVLWIGKINTQLFFIKKTHSVFIPLQPSKDIEWISGIRKNKILFFLFFIGGFIFSIFPYGLFPSIIAFNLVIISFFQHHESLQILIKEEIPPFLFIQKKIARHLYIYILCTFPWLCVSSLLHLDLVGICSMFYVYTLFINVCYVLIKYASYEPNQTASFSFQSNLLVVCLFVPFLLPLPLFIGCRSYYQSIYRLKRYLYDFY